MSRAGRAGSPGPQADRAEDESEIEFGAVQSACDDRRRSDRLPFPAELVLAWNHAPDSSMRYQVIDAGDGGYRIHSSMPMLEGTTGMVLRLLPGKTATLGQPVMVAWCAETQDELGYEIGLRFF